MIVLDRLRMTVKSISSLFLCRFSSSPLLALIRPHINTRDLQPHVSDRSSVNRIKITRILSIQTSVISCWRWLAWKGQSRWGRSTQDWRVPDADWLSVPTSPSGERFSAAPSTPSYIQPSPLLPSDPLPSSSSVPSPFLFRLINQVEAAWSESISTL